MANPKVENEEIESLKSFELPDDDSSGEHVIESPAIRSKLLHHLVDVSKAFQRRPGDRESEELLKANNALVSELLNVPLKSLTVETAPKNPQTAWVERLVQQLIDEGVDLANEQVQELANKHLDELVCTALSMKRSEDKVTFTVEIDSEESVSRKTARLFDDLDSDAEKPLKKIIYLRGLAFDIRMWSYQRSYESVIYLNVDCIEMPEHMSCKVQIEATIKNHAGKRDWVRSFNKVFGQKSKPKSYDSPLHFSVSGLIAKEEYADESQGLMKDDKLEIEIVLKADELVEVKEPLNDKEQSLDDKKPMKDEQLENALLKDKELVNELLKDI